jgi:hypothetical protein
MQKFVELKLSLLQQPTITFYTDIEINEIFTLSENSPPLNTLYRNKKLPCNQDSFIQYIILLLIPDHGLCHASVGKEARRG